MTPTLDTLLAASAGLLMPSENDYPFEPFVWAGDAPPTPAALVAALGLPPETPVEIRSLERLFAPLIRERDTDDEQARAQRARFAALRAAFEGSLADITVYRVGAIAIKVIIAGVDGDSAVVGLSTTVIET